MADSTAPADMACLRTNCPKELKHSLWTSAHDGMLDAVCRIRSVTEEQECPKSIHLHAVWASVNGDHTNVLEELLRTPAIPIDDIPTSFDNSRGTEYWFPDDNPLQLACSRGKLEMAQLLLRYGADVNAKGRRSSALTYACRSGQKDLVTLLLNANAEIDPSKELSNHTPLQAACDSGDLEMCQLLLARGASVRTENRYHRTALHYAARKNVDISSLLIAHGADANAATKTTQEGCCYVTGRTPLHEAASCGRLDIVELLLEHKTDVNATSFNDDSRHLSRDHSSKLTALHEAAENGHVSIVAHLRNHGAVSIAQPYSALGRATYRGHLEVIKELIRGGIDINEHHGAALRTACKGTLLEKNFKLALVRWLVDSGADVNAYSDGFEHGAATPLHAAAEAGDTEVVQFLVKQGAQSNVIGFYGSALSCAVRSHDHPREEILRLLVENGEDVNSSSYMENGVLKQGKHSLWSALAHEEDDVASLLIEFGAQPDDLTKRLALQRQFSLVQHS